MAALGRALIGGWWMSATKFVAVERWPVSWDDTVWLLAEEDLIMAGKSQTSRYECDQKWGITQNDRFDNLITNINNR
jgi:hypothetical protein